MPKRKLVKPSEAVLKAIKEAQERGLPLSEEEANLIRRSAYPLSYPKLPRDVTSDIGYDGKRRYWDADHPKGPGSLEVPVLRQVQKMERDFLAEAAKLRRRPPTDAAAKARKAQSKGPKIEAAWREIGFDTPGAAEQIAALLHVSAAHVRKVRKRMRQSESTA